MRCKACHYSLKELTEPRCPECGRAFDPDDPGTFERGWYRANRDHAVVAFLYLVNLVLSWLFTFFILPPWPGSSREHFIASVKTASIWTVVVAPILMNVYFALGRANGRLSSRDQS